MEFTKKAQDFKRGLPRFRHRLVGYCRKMFAVLICTSMVLGGFPSAFYEALAADGDGDYIYELDGTAIYEALDTAIAEGRTLDSELKFSGDHKAEYDELFNPDGTLYELEDLKFDRDLERDKEVGLRVFMRVEGDIALDEAYEVDGTEEVIFLLTNRTDEEVTVQINVDGYHTEVITIPAAKDIPVEIDKDSAGGEAAEASAEEVTEGAPAGGSGAGAAGGTGTETGSEEDTDDEADTKAAEEAEDKEDSAPDDADAESESDDDPAGNEDSSESSDNDSDEGSDTEASSDDSTDNDASSGKSEKDDGKESEGKDHSDSSDSSDKEDKDSSSGKDSSSDDKEDKGSSKDTESSEDKGSSGDKEDKDSSSERSFSGEKGSSERSTSGRSRGDKSDSGEKTASISVNKTQLLAAAIVDEPEEDSEEGDPEPQEVAIEEEIADAEVAVEAAPDDEIADAETAATETASPSDASPSDAWSMNGTSYEAVRLGNRGAVAYVTTTEEFGLERMLPASTVLTYEGEDYIVTVSYGRDAGLPRGVELTANEYDKDSETYQERLAEAAELNEWDDSAFEERIVYDDDDDEEGHVESIADYIRLFDISLNKDGAEVEPDAEVEVAISYLDADEPADMETGYTIIHFGDNEVEAIEPETEYQDEDETQIITFSISSFSDVMVIEDNDYGITLFAVAASPDYFTFINTHDIDRSKHVDDAGEIITDHVGNKYYIIDNEYTPVDVGNRFVFNYNTLDIDSMDSPSGKLSIEKAGYTNANDVYLLLDISELAQSGATYTQSAFEEKVSGHGTEITGNNGGFLGSFKFTSDDKYEVGAVEGQPVDVEITINSVRLYNSFASQFQTRNGYAPDLPKNRKLNIGKIVSDAFWVGIDGVSGDSSGTAWDYNNNSYHYPVIIDIDMTVAVEYTSNVYDADGKLIHNAGEIVDKSFLQVASDIDIYHNDASNAYQYGFFAETFKAIDGFPGTYYIYESDADYIAAEPTDVQGNTHPGEVWVQSDDDVGGNTSGDNEYKMASLYADTDTGTWTVGYSEGRCTTRIEIYNYTVDNLWIQKVDKDDTSIDLEDAEFLLYKKDASGSKYYYSGCDEDYQQALWTGADDIDSAQHLITKEGTDKDGNSGAFATAYYLEPGEYYLVEVKAPDGYTVLPYEVYFEMTTFGAVNVISPVLSGTDEDDIKPSNVGGEILFLIKDTAGTRLPDTGGSGSEPFRMAGMLISGSALGLLYIALRRRRRWIES